MPIDIAPASISAQRLKAQLRVAQSFTLNSAVHFKFATTEADIESIFRLRYDVLVETDRYYPANESRKIQDRFDKLDTTILFMALIDGTLVGTVRLVLDSAFGVPSEDYFSVDDMLDRSKLIADLSRIAVRKQYRNFGMAYDLMRLGQTVGFKLGVSQFVGVSNPKALSLFERLGWQAIGVMDHSVKYNVPFIPIMAHSKLAERVDDIPFSALIQSN